MLVCPSRPSNTSTFLPSNQYREDTEEQNQSGVHPIVLKELSKLRRKSIRKGVWFNALTKIQRGIVDLTLRYVERVRSKILEKVLSEIMSKLRYVVDHFFTWMLELTGQPIAERMSRAAAALGVKGADRWMEDQSYIQLLGLHDLSTRCAI